jgi:hypothetical protein
MWCSTSSAPSIGRTQPRLHPGAKSMNTKEKATKFTPGVNRHPRFRRENIRRM